MKRSQRQKKIIELIEKKEIQTQIELMQELIRHGYKITQATVSRDIKQLGLLKTATANGGYKYIYNNAKKQEKQQKEKDEKLLTLFKKSVISITKALNLIVLTTISGSANSACYTIDTLDIDGIVGTLAGDDTIFIAVRSQQDRDLVFQKLQHLLDEE